MAMVSTIAPPMVMAFMSVFADQRETGIAPRHGIRAFGAETWNAPVFTEVPDGSADAGHPPYAPTERSRALNSKFC